MSQTVGAWTDSDWWDKYALLSRISAFGVIFLLDFTQTQRFDSDFTQIYGQKIDCSSPCFRVRWHMANWPFVTGVSEKKYFFAKECFFKHAKDHTLQHLFYTLAFSNYVVSTKETKGFCSVLLLAFRQLLRFSSFLLVFWTEFSIIAWLWFVSLSGLDIDNCCTWTIVQLQHIYHKFCQEKVSSQLVNHKPNI